MHPLLITFATQAEAQESLQVLKVKQVDEQTYQFDGGWLKITGIGCLAAQAAILQSPPAGEIWNLGIAGALSPHLSPFSTYPVAKVNKWLPMEIGDYDREFALRSHPSRSLGKPGLSLYSSDYPIHNRRTSSADLVDMEGYGVAEGAKRLGVPCHIWKTVSDRCTPKGPEDIRRRLPELSHCIAEHLHALLEERQGSGT